MKQPLTAVKIGNMNTAETLDLTAPLCRPKAQVDAILEYHKKNPSAWWCGAGFEAEPDGRVFKCTFSHAYFTPDGRYCAVLVTPTGRIKPSYIGEPKESFKADADAVIAVHGAFKG